MKGAVIGVYPATGLGDLIQYLTAALMITDNIKELQLYLSIPKHSLARKYIDSLLRHRNVRIVKGLVELLKENLPVRLRDATSHGIKIANPDYVKSMFTASTLFLKYCIPPLAKLLNRITFDFCIVGGHSIDDNAVRASGISSAIMFYRAARALTRGPLIMFPFSVTDNINTISSRKVELLKESIKKFDVICVRGFYTKETLEKFVDSSRIIVAPDTTFYIRNVFQHYTSIRIKNENRLVRITLVLRRDYFLNYNLVMRYYEYLRAIVNVIRTLRLKYDVKVTLLIHEISKDIDVVRDFVKLVRRLGLNKRINVVVPKSLLEDLEYIVNSDIVVSSRLHAGLISLSAGIPTLFILPPNDIRIRDIFSLLGLDLNSFVINMFDTSSILKLPAKVSELVENITKYKALVEQSVNRIMSILLVPVKVLLRLIS